MHENLNKDPLSIRKLKSSFNRRSSSTTIHGLPRRSYPDPSRQPKYTTLILSTSPILLKEIEESNHQELIMSSSSSSSSPSSSFESEMEELRRLENAPPFWKNPKAKRLSKQLSMLETPRDIAWEKRRRQIFMQERKKNGINDSDDLTDEDLSELKGCIELGFGFNEEQGQKLCNTLPALDLYFAVNRNLSMSPVLSPNSTESAPALGGRSTSFGSDSADSWKICSPGDDPQHVKTKLRHWAQAVACSVRQSF